MHVLVDVEAPGGGHILGCGGVTALRKICPSNRQEHEELMNLDKQVMMRI